MPGSSIVDGLTDTTRKIPNNSKSIYIYIYIGNRGQILNSPPLLLSRLLPSARHVLNPCRTR